MREKKFLENPLTFGWSMILSKFKLKDLLNPLVLSSGKNYVYLQKNYLCQLTTMPNLIFFIFSFGRSD